MGNIVESHLNSSLFLFMIHEQFWFDSCPVSDQKKNPASIGQGNISKFGFSAFWIFLQTEDQSCRQQKQEPRKSFLDHSDPS